MTKQTENKTGCRESTNKSIERLSVMSDEFEKLSSPSLALSKKLRKQLSGYSLALEQLEQLSSPGLALSEKLRKQLSGYSLAQEQLEQMSNPGLALSEQLRNQLSGFQEQLKKISSPSLSLSKRLREQLSGFSELHQQLIKPESVINSSLFGDLNVSSVDAISQVDESNISEQILILSEESQSDIEFIDNLFLWLSSQQESVQKLFNYFLLCVFIPYAISVAAGLTTPFYENKLNQYQSSDLRIVKKEIINTTIEKFSTPELQVYRFVYATALNVRSFRSKKSEIIDKVYLGKTVKLINKLKSWSWIEYENDSEETVQGWVLSRYLKRFSK